MAFRTSTKPCAPSGVAYNALEDDPPERAGEVERELVFAGVVGIIDPPRDEARIAIVEAHRAGMRALMITG